MPPRLGRVLLRFSAAPLHRLLCSKRICHLQAESISCGGQCHCVRMPDTRSRDVRQSDGWNAPLQGGSAAELTRGLASSQVLFSALMRPTTVEGGARFGSARAFAARRTAGADA